jgi:UDP-2,4-diacetamido-2,4,6-trideoxy-beta-L-altropyranose hydrolase
VILAVSPLRSIGGIAATLNVSMPAVTPPGGARIAFRCDGNEQVGAGHVARCVPLAVAFAELGWKVNFVGVYKGLASWLLARARIDARAPDLEAPCGVPPGEYDAVVLDSYLIAPAAICDLANALPIITLAEANRCATRGILLDYHLDGIENVFQRRSQPSGVDLLAGPSFAPLDPAFAGAGRAGREVRRVLVTVGGSLAARALLTEVLPIVLAALSDAEIVVAGAESETYDALVRVSVLPSPSALVEVVHGIDLTITAGGLTAYEMACAGIPQVVIAVAANQRRVVDGLRKNGLAPCLDLTAGDSLADLPNALEHLRDPELRRSLAQRGRNVFDGEGARRAASTLTRLLDASATR